MDGEGSRETSEVRMVQERVKVVEKKKKKKKKKKEEKKEKKVN